MAEDAGVIAALCPQTEQTDTESEGEAAGPADVAMLSEDEGQTLMMRKPALSTAAVSRLDLG